MGTGHELITSIGVPTVRDLVLALTLFCIALTLHFEDAKLLTLTPNSTEPKVLWARSLHYNIMHHYSLIWRLAFEACLSVGQIFSPRK